MMYILEPKLETIMEGTEIGHIRISIRLAQCKDKG